MRVLVEIEVSAGAGPLEGSVLVEGRSKATPFSGWLELLALLQEIRTSLPPLKRDEGIER